MTKEQTQTQVNNNLSKIGHWRVEIRPQIYNENLIKNIYTMYDIVNQSQVSLRGWPNPYFSFNEIERFDNGNNLCSMWVNPKLAIIHENEIWKFWKSGQFIHKFGFVEDSGSKLYNSQSVNNGYFSVLNVLYTLTEIFYFAQNMQNNLKIDDPIVVKITLNNVKNRYLVKDDFINFRHNECLNNTIEFDIFTLTKTELYKNIDEIIINTLTEFFNYFNYKPSNMQYYIEEQQKYIKGI